MAFAVAAGHPRTAEAAAEVLREGGTAVDACIAAGFMSGVAEPVLSGLLGGGFLTVVPADGEPVCLDAFVQTPRRMRPETEIDRREVVVDFGATEQVFHAGAGTIATPGLVAGLFEAHGRFGRLPMPELAAQAVSAARQGMKVDDFQSHVLDLVSPIFTMHPSSKAIYATDDGLLKPGDLFSNPALADVMEVLSHEGPGFFEQGEIAGALLALEGSHLTAGDLAGYTAQWRVPLAMARQGFDIFLNPPPSLGGVQIALALTALPDNPRPAQVAKAFAAISRLRRQTHADTYPENAAGLLLDPELVAALRASLADRMQATRGTTHISVLDASGTGAALTLSNGEGCGLVLPGTGLMPNNMLGEEDLVPHGPQSWVPDRRLASMMCPMSLRSPGGGLTMMGSGGSNRIRSALTQVALRLIDAQEPLEDAITAPRMHYEHATEHGIDLEDFGDGETRAAILKDWPKAHVWSRSSMFFGGVHAVRKTGGGYEAAGDPRRSGVGIVG
ncbi:MAG: gamma-glutamyltransferase [Paracoccaceae bacterium]